MVDEDGVGVMAHVRSSLMSDYERDASGYTTSRKLTLQQRLLEHGARIQDRGSHQDVVQRRRHSSAVKKG